MGQVTSSKDFLMLLLYAKGHRGEQAEPIVGRTRLVKMVFLFEQEIRKPFRLEQVVPDSALPQFEAYHYGPYSRAVFDDLEFLMDMEFVSAAKSTDGAMLAEERDEYEHWLAESAADDATNGFVQEQVFRLTDLGREFVEAGEAGELTEEQWDVLDRFKARCTSATLDSLIKYIYTKYPSYAEKSRIRDKVMS